ncbi:Lateral organ boundary [Sesbania bispinosa]|nr:Lateral organ boundary [Sesbania bispinosa]
MGAGLARGFQCGGWKLADAVTYTNTTLSLLHASPSSSLSFPSISERGGPCGACKFLRRKCVKGCIFAPYFDSDQGTLHFAAVHKVFGASNASKLLMRIPAHKRVDAVVTLCYEALARTRDPVYGCVAHIFALQQQVMNLQAELTYVQARLATMQRLPLPVAPPLPHPQTSSSTSLHSSSDHLTLNADLQSATDLSMQFDPLQSHSTSLQLSTFFDPSDQQLEDGELHALAREFVTRYLPGHLASFSRSVAFRAKGNLSKTDETLKDVELNEQHEVSKGTVRKRSKNP